MKEKIKEFVKSTEVKCAGAMSTMAMVAMSSGAVSAAEGDGASTAATVTSAFQTGFQTMASDALSMIAVIVPIALSVAGVVYLCRKAIGWFKSMAK